MTTETSLTSPPQTSEQTSADETVEEDLIEEVSIDGMCGVY